MNGIKSMRERRGGRKVEGGREGIVREGGREGERIVREGGREGEREEGQQEREIKMLGTQNIDAPFPFPPPSSRLKDLSNASPTSSLVSSLNKSLQLSSKA